MSSTGPAGPVSRAADESLERQLREEDAVLELVTRPLTERQDAAAVFVAPTPEADLPLLRRRFAARGAELERRLFTIFVDRIPRTPSGEVDEECLARLAVLDERLVSRHRDDLRMALGLAQLDLRIEPASNGDADPRVPAALPRTADRPPPLAAVHAPAASWPADMPATLPEALERAAGDHPTHGVIAYDDEGSAVTISYPALLAQARRVARRLAEAGVAAGDVVLVATPHLCDYFGALWGAMLAGATPMTLAAPAAYENRSPALDKLHGAWAGSGKPWIVASGEAVEGLSVAARLYGGEAPRVLDARADAPPAEFDLPRAGGEVALLQLSSGTTGRAKPILLTHRGLLASALDYRRASGLESDDRAVNWLPLDHSASLLLTHVFAVVAGATNVHVPTVRILADPLRWLELMERHDAQHTWAPSFAYRLVAKALEQAPARHMDLAGVRSLVNGGEPCVPAVVEHFLRASSRLGIRPRHMLFAWGMAETTTAIAYRRHASGDVGAERHGRSGSGTTLSMGPPCPGSEMRVVADDGTVLREGEVGRLLVRSDRVTPGYLVDGAVQPAAGDDGWLDTGDLAFIHAGEIHIAGRVKDEIIVNGVNVPAHEVEQAAGDVDGIESGSVAALAVPDAEHGTEGLAVVYVAAGQPTQSDLDAAVRTAVARATGIVPAIVVAIPVQDFPRTSTGKIQRAALRTRLLAGDFGDFGAVDFGAVDPTPAEPAAEPCTVRALEQLVLELPASADPPPALPPLRDGAGRPLVPRIVVAGSEPGSVPPSAARAATTDDASLSASVRAAFAAVAGGRVAPDRPYNEAGLGSLELMRVHAQLERRLGIRIAPTAMFEFPTIAALIEHLAARRAPSVAARRSPRSEGASRAIAIVGMACRLPGARSPEAYWELLRAGRTAVRRFSAEELLAAGVAEEVVADPDFVPVTGSLDDIDRFAPEAFGMTVREAALTAPQQRLLLEVAHELLVVSGHETYETEGGGEIGVFAGTGMFLAPLSSYLLTQLLGSLDPTDPVSGLQILIGNEPDFAASRIAYRLGLTGPAVGVQTACSTALAAVHLACRALLAGDCDVAIAGAGAVQVPHPNGYVYRKGAILSPTGSCRAFDARADGTVGGNGVAAVMLKPLDAAERDGDRVHAVIRGSGMNNDGATKVGFTAPSVRGQALAIRRALASAEVRADTVAYVQAHGTGTIKGDPIEVQALKRAFEEDGCRRGACVLGSVKPNVGHLDTCAGFAGLIAAVLALRHREAPPQINYDVPNPELGLDDSPFRIVRTPEPLERMGAPLRASVSALGVGGTNVHVVLEEAA